MNEELPLSPDDPRITAFALGELEGDERQFVAAAVASDPALRAVVDEIRATAAKLEAVLAAEAADATEESTPAPAAMPIIPGRDPGKLDGGSSPYDRHRAKLLRFPQLYYIVGGLAAAGVAVMVALYPSYQRNRTIMRDLASAEAAAKAAPKQKVVSEEERAREARIRDQKDAYDQALQSSTPPSMATAPTAPSQSLSSGTATAQGGGGSSGAQRNFYQTSGGSENYTVESYDFGRGPNEALLGAGTSQAAGGLAGVESSQTPIVRADPAATPPASTPAAAATPTDQEEVVRLNPFEVASEPAGSFQTTSVGTGGRLALNLQDAANLPGGRGGGGAGGFGSAGQYFSRGSTTDNLGRNYYLPTSPLNTESYAVRQNNTFLKVSDQPLSTFSIDVDTASYANVRRFLQQGQLPPVDAVRVEEMVNYFPYRYEAPPPLTDAREAANSDVPPFAATLEVASDPWNPSLRLVRIGLKGREVSTEARPRANLVFLLDVSGSMSDPNKLPLVKESMRLLLRRLREDDRVAIVVYAGASGVALPSTPAAQSAQIAAAIDRLTPGGSTNGAQGIQLAYNIARSNFVDGGINRVILCTDGDFNVGITNQGDLVRLVEQEAKSNVFLTVLGFGMGNLKDSTLELLADKGNGNYGYIDNRNEAEKLLADQVNGTLVTIAKDVKIQVEFNPAQVSAYRLIGYENRLLAKEDFNNDAVDAGEIGAGHTVTALYEVVPANGARVDAAGVPAVDDLKYQPQVAASRPATPPPTPVSQEMLTVKLRYKEPTGDVSRKLEFPLTDQEESFSAASPDFRFAAAVAGFGLALRESPVNGNLLGQVLQWAGDGLKDDPNGYRAEFADLVRRAQAIAGVRPQPVPLQQPGARGGQ